LSPVLNNLCHKGCCRSVRIGLVKPTVQMGSGDTAQASDTIRNMLSEYLSGPTMQVTLLEARLPDQFEEEARRAGCNYILSTDVVHHRGRAVRVRWAERLGNFGYLPAKGRHHLDGIDGAVRTAADVASSIKAKDEMPARISVAAAWREHATAHEEVEGPRQGGWRRCSHAAHRECRDRDWRRSVETLTSQAQDRNGLDRQAQMKRLCRPANIRNPASTRLRLQLPSPVPTFCPVQVPSLRRSSPRP
jgi:hypothetical protein